MISNHPRTVSANTHWSLPPEKLYRINLHRNKLNPQSCQKPNALIWLFLNSFDDNKVRLLMASLNCFDLFARWQQCHHWYYPLLFHSFMDAECRDATEVAWILKLFWKPMLPMFKRIAIFRYLLNAFTHFKQLALVEWLMVVAVVCQQKLNLKLILFLDNVFCCWKYSSS